jgi:hypothetical protein
MIDPEGVYMRLVPERVWISHCKNKHKKSCRALESNSLPYKQYEQEILKVFILLINIYE